MSTEYNLKEAFAGESQANRKYLAFAKKADEEGYLQVARLFRAVAAAETVHAHNHLKVMKGIGDTEENLKGCQFIDGLGTRYWHIHAIFYMARDSAMFVPGIIPFGKRTSLNWICHLERKRLDAVWNSR